MNWKVLLPAIRPALLMATPASAQRGRGGPGAGWRTWATPATPEQTAHLDEATNLYSQLQQKRVELRALPAQPQPSQAAIQVKQAEMQALQDRVCALNQADQTARQQMGMGTRRAARLCSYGAPSAHWATGESRARTPRQRLPRRERAHTPHAPALTNQTVA